MAKNKYFPTLIIGAGGTGIKVLRFIQSLADSGMDNDLKDMLDIGAIQMVGIDTDKKSNEEVLIVDQNLTASQNTSEQEEEKIPPKLTKLPKNWIHLDRGALNHAVTRVHEATGIEVNDSEDGEKVRYPLESIRDWFPLRNERTKDQITLGHSKLAGAAQWRPLGRMALFLNASRVYETIQKVFKTVQQANPEEGPIRAFVVASLAGGTGSGMFWDLAFFLQMIDPGTQTSGMFLLGDPFESVDEGGRIFPNIYAALKEMATYKNWRQELRVNYPIGKGKVFKGRPLGPLAFDMVYLYQAFTPGPHVTDRSRATIDISCYRLAQNLLALSRRDLHAILDVGANNMDSDTTAMPSSIEASYCFSTTGTTIFSLRKANDIERELRYLLIQRLRPERFTQPAPIDRKFLFNLLRLEEGNEARLAILREKILEEGLKAKPESLTRYLGEINDALDHLKQDPLVSPEVLKSKLSTELLTELERAIDLKRDEFDLGNMEPLYEQTFRNYLESFDLALGEMAAEVKKSSRALSSNAEAMLREWKTELETQLNENGANANVTVRLPKSFRKMRHLGEAGIGRLPATARVASAAMKWLNGQDSAEKHLRENCQKIFTDLAESLKTYSPGQRSSIAPILNREWNKYRKNWLERIDLVLSEANGIRDTQKERLQFDEQIQSAFSSEKRPENPPEKSQLTDFLRLCIPPETTRMRRDDWLEEHLRELAPRIYESLNSGVPRDERKTPDRRQWLNPLREMTESYEKQELEDPKNLTLEPIVLFHTALLKDYPCDTPAQAKHLIELSRHLANTVVNYWNAKGNYLLQQAGGESGLRERLTRCRSKLYSNGIIENKLNKRHLIVMPFSPESEEQSEEDRRSIQETFDILAQEVMHTKSMVSSEPSDNPIIFYNDLFRSAEEISRIRDYYNAYTTFGKNGNTTFYHIDAGMAALPDIVGNAIEVLPVSCGNAGCHTNLRNVSRKEIICPGCNKPIWNRCGNPKCYENDLIEQLKSKESESIKQRVPYECPSCGNELKTYWWRCSDATHARKIPTDKETCTQCLIEFQQGKRTHENVRQRPDLRHLTCPGCIKLEEDESLQVKIPWALKHFYDEGVNGHDSIYFRRLLQSAKKDGSYRITGHLCTNTLQEHYLFPTCPKGRDQTDQRHHLYLNNQDRFGCTRHPNLRFYQCHYCKYPIEERENTVNGCPRCLRPVQKCHYCSDKYLQLYQPLANTEPERCPNCRNPMTGPEMVHPDTLENNLKEPAFCANIYGCKAGSNPWLCASEYDLSHCRVCPDPASPLLPRAYLEATVTNCPLCMVVITPIFENGKEVWVSGHSIQDRFSKKSNHQLHTPCLICGAKPLYVLKWMESGSFLRLSENSRTLQEVRKDTGGMGPNTWPEHIQKELENIGTKEIPAIAFQEAVDILQEFREKLDDRQVFSSLRRSISIQELLNWTPHQQESILRLFPPGSNFTLVLRKRMKGLWEHLEDLNNRKNQWLARPEP